MSDLTTRSSATTPLGCRFRLTADADGPRFSAVVAILFDEPGRRAPCALARASGKAPLRVGEEFVRADIPRISADSPIVRTPNPGTRVVAFAAFPPHPMKHRSDGLVCAGQTRPGPTRGVAVGFGFRTGLTQETAVRATTFPSPSGGAPPVGPSDVGQSP